jgi:hypothetical protein
VHPAIALRVPYGFDLATSDELRFPEIPEVRVQRSICGALRVDDGYTLDLADSVIDAGAAVGDDGSAAFAVCGSQPGDPPDSVHGWGAPLRVSGVTFFGRVRAERVEGRGGIFVHRLEARDNQHGCLRQSWLSGQGDRLPQHYACVFGPGARLSFTAEEFGQPGYAQLAASSDFSVRERGPGDDAMGAYGFLREAHAWRNLEIRFREFVPAGVRAIAVAVT